MPQQLNLPLKSPESYDRSDFFVTSANQEAYNYIESWPNWPHFCCILYGEAGSGKTHLSKIFQDKANAIHGDLSTISTGYNLILDDLNLKGGLFPQEEESLFHIFNSQKGDNKNLLIITDTSPTCWEIQLPDLKSRLRGTPCIRVHPPDDQLLYQVYAKLFADHQTITQPQVLEYIIKNTERSFENAPKLVEKTVTKALSERRNITIPLIKEILNNNI